MDLPGLRVGFLVASKLCDMRNFLTSVRVDLHYSKVMGPETSISNSTNS